MPVLATSFKVLGGLLGLPGVALLIHCGFHAMQRRLHATLPPESGVEANGAGNSNGLVMILRGVAEALGTVGRFANALDDMIYGIFTGVATLAVVLGVALWLTGRGLHTQAGWARVVAVVLALGVGIPSILYAISVEKWARVIPVVVVVCSALALRTLWIGYAASHS